MVVHRSKSFDDWLKGMRDHTGKLAILSRLDRIAFGLFGDSKSVGSGTHELRIDVGPGYRVYFTRVGDDVFVLRGGTKSTQAADILKAQAIAAGLVETAKKRAEAAAPAGTKQRKPRDPSNSRRRSKHVDDGHDL